MKSPKFTNSLSFRLSVLVAVVVTAGVSLVAGIFIAQDFQKTVSSERARLSDTATAFAAASSAPVKDRDISALYQVLRGISDIGNSTFIGVRDLDNRPIAEMGAGVALNGRDGHIDQHSLWSLMQADTLSVDAVIWSGGLKIGTLTIQSDISWLREQYKANLSLMCLIGLVSALIIAATTNWAIRRALRPLKHISGELLEMGARPDLAKRFNFAREDEVGVLANAFNNAFDTIQQRDNAIRHHRDTLETTVQERTSELKLAADDARQANAAKSDFLATMSHEIRTPMNGMLVMAELLSASDLSSRQQRFAEVISRSGNSLLHIINDILDLSKVESGKLELEEVPFSLSTLIEDTVSLFAARAHEKSLKIGMVISPEIASEYVGDPTRLGQILSNLTNNALKFTEEGGVIIKVSAEECGKDQRLKISVSDSGIGIAAEKLDSIFDAFSQADQSTTRNYGGTGLGLSISKRFTEAMGGEISAASVEDQGTTFTVTVTLPVFVEADRDVQPERPFKIGVIDNSDIIQSATIEMLNLAGLEAFELSDDPNGIEPDLIVAGNHNFADRRYSNTPIVLLTEYGDAGVSQMEQNKLCANINSPLSRSDARNLISALNASDWSLIETTGTARNSKLAIGEFGELNVLAVDDNAVNREVLNEALSALGVRATFASSGQEAVDLANEQAFDIIFMDCSMPGMDGYQATAAIRENTMSESACIVALTAHVTGPSAERWKSAGMDNYIAKPFTVAQLDSVLRQVEPSEQLAPVVDNPTMVGEQAALISDDVLAMFETVSAATGNDMKTKVFAMFCGQVDEGASALFDCYQSKQDTKALKELAHALKSMCSSAGALRAQLLCDDIEVNAENDNWPHEEQIAQLKTAIEDTKIYMNQRPSKSLSSSAAGGNA